MSRHDSGVDDAREDYYNELRWQEESDEEHGLPRTWSADETNQPNMWYTGPDPVPDPDSDSESEIKLDLDDNEVMKKIDAQLKEQKETIAELTRQIQELVRSIDKTPTNTIQRPVAEPPCCVLQ